MKCPQCGGCIILGIDAKMRCESCGVDIIKIDHKCKNIKVGDYFTHMNTGTTFYCSSITEMESTSRDSITEVVIELKPLPVAKM